MAPASDSYHADVCAACPNLLPSPYKISTITATGDLGAPLDLPVFYRAVPLRAPRRGGGGEDWGFASAQFSSAPTRSVVAVILDDNDPGDMADAVAAGGALMRRTAIGSDGAPVPIQRSSRRKRRPTRHFDNQCTLIYWERERLENGIERGVNVKCFRNGRIQMTGVRVIEEGARIVRRLSETVAELGLVERGRCASSTAEPGRYKVRLINSDFNIGFQVRRDVLHRILAGELGLVCAFEPCIYPGVKLSFMWNDNKGRPGGQRQDGRCDCERETGRTCNGDGDGPGRCRKVTCVTFQSGCTIITGAHDHEQIEATYRFICGVASRYREEIERRPAPPPTATSKI